MSFAHELIVHARNIGRSDEFEQLVADHDAEIANDAAKKALMDAASSLHGRRMFISSSELIQWLNARAESYGGQ